MDSNIFQCMRNKILAFQFLLIFMLNFTSSRLTGERGMTDSFVASNNTTQEVVNQRRIENQWSQTPYVDTPRQLDPTCEGELIRNGDFENGFTNGWKAFQTGRRSGVRIIEGGANNSSKALECYGRKNFGGPMIPFINDCLVPGQKYIITAQIKITDEDDQPVKMNKHAKWKEPTFLALSILSDHQTNGIKVLNSVNQIPFRGLADFNAYRAIVEITEEQSEAKKVLLFFRGPAKGFKIILDEVSMKPYYPPPKYCDKPLYNGDAEISDPYLNTLGWEIGSNGFLDVISPGANSQHAFLNTGRISGYNGLSQVLDSKCLVADANYRFHADFKLINKDGIGVSCDREQKDPGQGQTCPLVVIRMLTDFGVKYQYTWNDERRPWNPNEFNRFYGSFRATNTMMNAKEVSMIISGPALDKSIAFDNVRFYIDCSMIFVNTKAERGNTGWWKTLGGGTIDTKIGGAGGSPYAFIHENRVTPQSGIGQDIDPICIKDENYYLVTTDVMILDKDDNPVFVDKYAKPEDDSYLAYTIQVVINDESERVAELRNSHLSEWENGAYNRFYALFKYDSKFSLADHIRLFLYGPNESYKIVFDNMEIDKYLFPEQTCENMIINGDAETENTLHWNVEYQEFLNIKPGGALPGSKFYFEYVGRQSGLRGLSQELNLLCMDEGTPYSFKAYVKLMKNGIPHTCSLDVKMPDEELSCPQIGFKTIHGNETKYEYYTVSNTDEWIADEFNELWYSFEVSPDMATADRVDIVITGPPAGVDILMDDLEMFGQYPSTFPSTHPSLMPSSFPSILPSSSPSTNPSNFPTTPPSLVPSQIPSSFPSILPSSSPSTNPSNFPTTSPSLVPSQIPSSFPSVLSSSSPSTRPSNLPTESHSSIPSQIPSSFPSVLSSSSPSTRPSNLPTESHSSIPSQIHSFSPSALSSSSPSTSPSNFPTTSPSLVPSQIPSFFPSVLSSSSPSTRPSNLPTESHSSIPSLFVSDSPSVLSSSSPSSFPSIHPSNLPSLEPSSIPTNLPSIYPSINPSDSPTISHSPSLSPAPSVVLTRNSRKHEGLDITLSFDRDKNDNDEASYRYKYIYYYNYKRKKSKKKHRKKHYTYVYEYETPEFTDGRDPVEHVETPKYNETIHVTNRKKHHKKHHLHYYSNPRTVDRDNHRSTRYSSSEYSEYTEYSSSNKQKEYHNKRNKYHYGSFDTSDVHEDNDEAENNMGSRSTSRDTFSEGNQNRYYYYRHVPKKKRLVSDHNMHMSQDLEGLDEGIY